MLNKEMALQMFDPQTGAICTVLFLFLFLFFQMSWRSYVDSKFAGMEFMEKSGVP